jgi:hypothetical protein
MIVTIYMKVVFFLINSLMCVLCDLDFGFIQNACKFFNCLHLFTFILFFVNFIIILNCLLVYCIVLDMHIVGSCCFHELM